ncbi:immunoglobulin-like domain-containing protein [Thermococcus sp.]
MSQGKFFIVILTLSIIAIIGASYRIDSGKSTPFSMYNESSGASVTMTLDKTTYHAGERLNISIINNGGETLLVGSFYRLYRLKDGKWVEMPLGFSFTGIGYQIGPGQNWTQTIPLMVARNGKLEPLPPGRYRIEKTVIIDMGALRKEEHEITLSAEFEVVG